MGHFDRIFYLGLSAQERQDLVAYLEAIGDGEQALLADSIETRVKEISDFLGVWILPCPNAMWASLR